MEQIVKILVDNGIAVACVGYFMYFQLVTMKDITKVMNETVRALDNVNERLLDIEKKIGGKKKNEK